MFFIRLYGIEMSNELDKQVRLYGIEMSNELDKQAQR